MDILTNYLKNECIQKSYSLQAADWFLTPYRKIFNGKEIELTENINDSAKISFSLNESSFQLTYWEKALWVIPALIASPFAFIAAIFKRCGNPSVKIDRDLRWDNINQPTDPLTKEEAEQLEETLKSAGIYGKITFWDGSQQEGEMNWAEKTLEITK